LFAALLVIVAWGLHSPGERVIRSKLVGKPMPDFALAQAVPTHRTLRSADLQRGRPRLVNIFASWCVPCRAEAGQLLALKAKGVPIDAIAIRDKPEDITAFLQRWGDPFERIGSDPESQVQLALGSAGVPETFVVDGKGIIRYQHIGAIGDQDLADVLAAYEAAR
jgi:cytochrome c biogenesis protein CcmG/thiol:disulfide interchange protein DsbE